MVGETVPNSRGWLQMYLVYLVEAHSVVGETVPNSRGWLLLMLGCPREEAFPSRRDSPEQ